MSFIGKKNNQEYLLMIPNKLVWESASGSVKEDLDIGGENLFLIYGTENISIQKIPSGYWKNLGKDTTEIIFHKIVGLDKKITFASYEESDKLVFEYNDSQTETKFINTSELQQIQAYCQDYLR
ncbi:MAG: hypothetical protein mread185_000434 [Mycoplasmataceae bacterium]|nr:MAG: hypothetical protein mread185_000434 [Mycoplasmataceae bacterium]